MVAEPGRAFRWALALLLGSALMAEPGSPTSPATAAIGAGGLIDTKAYGKLRTFDGKEESWATWSFVARSYFGLLSPQFDTYISASEAQSVPVAMAELTERAQVHSRTLYHVLVQSVEGKALSILMNVEKQNGLEGWRALVEAYQPDLGGRHTSMLMGIISPAWEKVTEADFLESLEQWEVLIRRYQDQAVDVVSGATKIAVLMKYAPPALRGALRTNASFMGSDYERVKKFMRDWLQSGAVYNSVGETTGAPSTPGGPMPMDVGAIDYKGQKGKGKDGKGKSAKGKEGKAKGSGKGSDKFQGECGYCGKWGHKRKDCWAKQKKEQKGGGGKGGGKGKSKTTAAVEQGEPESTAAAIHYYVGDPEDAGRESEEDGEERWVMAIEAAAKHGTTAQNHEAQTFVLYDSGSDENVCPYDATTDLYDEPSTVALRDVAGGKLSTGRQRTLSFRALTTAGKVVEIRAVFQVSKACLKLVMSAGKMIKAGYGAMLVAGGGSLWHPSGSHVPLAIYGNATYLKAWGLTALPGEGQRQLGRPKAVAAPVAAEPRLALL